MIIKSFEAEKIKSLKNNLILLYGANEGHKNQVINELFKISMPTAVESPIISDSRISRLS